MNFALKTLCVSLGLDPEQVSQAMENIDGPAVKLAVEQLVATASELKQLPQFLVFVGNRLNEINAKQDRILAMLERDQGNGDGSHGNRELPFDPGPTG